MNKNLKLFVLVIVLYLLLTLGEVVVHKYIMHNKDNSFIRRVYGNSHNVHHLDVLDDMKLKDNYEEEGLYFDTKYTIILSLVIFIIYYPVILLFQYKINILYILGLSLGIGLFYKFSWDYLHYSFHQINTIEDKKKNKLFNWLFKNHSYHHLVKGNKKGNFNIIFPGGDHILNSYNNCIDNKEYCKNPNPTHIKICEKERKRSPLKHGLRWCDT